MQRSLTPDKLNFSPAKADKIDALHERVAKRLRWVVDTNQGMYLKLGQAIGAWSRERSSEG